MAWHRAVTVPSPPPDTHQSSEATPLRKPYLIPLSAALVAACASAGPSASSDETLARARGIHERVMALDTHVDIDPGNFRVGELNYANRLNTQVDLTKMEEGGLDAIFF